MFHTIVQLLSIPVLVASLLLSTGCGAGKSTSSKPDERPSTKAAPTSAETTAPTPKAKPVVVDAATLIKDFRSNHEQVFEKYGGKRLEVEAVVYDEERPAAPGKPLVLKLVQVDRPDSPLIEPIVCQIEPDSEDYGKAFLLSPGQKVTVQGRYEQAQPKGGSVTFAPHLFQCGLAAVGPDPAVAVTAAELTKAFATDPTAAAAKYKEKPVVVEGVVAQLEHIADKDLKLDSYTVRLEGTGKDGKPARVEIFNATSDVAGLKKGQTVKLKGKCVYGNDETVGVLFRRLLK